METINKREFVRHFSKYLKEKGKFCLTVKDKVVATVKITNGVHTGISILKEIPFKLSPESKNKEQPLVNAATNKDVTTYGCGCKRTDKLLCSKHGRY